MVTIHSFKKPVNYININTVLNETLKSPLKVGQEMDHFESFVHSFIIVIYYFFCPSEKNVPSSLTPSNNISHKMQIQIISILHAAFYCNQ